MKKRLFFLLMAACLAFVFAGCYKEPKPSKQVVITVMGECICESVFYDSVGSSKTFDYDCQYARYLPVELEEGLYQVVAEGFGGVVETGFKKERYSQDLGIDF